MKHLNVLVLGGTGFVGSHLVAQLVGQGRNVLVPTRRRMNGRHLILLPTVDVVDADVHDPVTLQQLATGQDAVINLVGILHGDRGKPYGKAFRRAHVELPTKVREACLAAGVARLLHMSALGAAADAPSMYLRSRAAGEAAVADPALQLTVFRPSVIFGPEDQFLNLFATLQKWFPVMPLAGADARFQPVHVGDVVRAMLHALDASATVGQVIELVGPRVYALRELVQLAGAMSGHRRPVIGLPEVLGRLQAWCMEHAPGPTLMSRDNLDSMKVANVASAPLAPEMARLLGIERPIALEDVAPDYLSPAAMGGHFDRYRQER